MTDFRAAALKYLALGDSISIDDYTGREGGGAASQLARLVNAGRVQDLTRDGHTSAGVLTDLEVVTIAPDVVTITACGNDFLQAAFYGEDPHSRDGRAALVERPVANLDAILDRLQTMCAPGGQIIVNTIYDPTDGDDSIGREFGIAASYRLCFYELNEGIRTVARRRGCLLADLHALFQGHGIGSAETWIVGHIEPNLAGATAIARCWYGLLGGDQAAAHRT